MKLTTIADKETSELLNEGPRNTKAAEVQITCPIGIDPDEFTEDYKNRLRTYQKTRPELFHKIMNGI